MNVNIFFDNWNSEIYSRQSLSFASIFKKKFDKNDKIYNFDTIYWITTIY